MGFEGDEVKPHTNNIPKLNYFRFRCISAAFPGSCYLPQPQPCCCSCLRSPLDLCSTLIDPCCRILSRATTITTATSTRIDVDLFAISSPSSDAPRCKPGTEQTSIGAINMHSLNVKCEVDADPPESIRFSWTYNNTRNVSPVCSFHLINIIGPQQPGTNDDDGCCCCRAQ